jgi:hypothetical protein
MQNIKVRWWNSFNILGILMLGLGICGFVFKGKFVFDPGRPALGYESALYVVTGGLMFINAWLTPTPVLPDKAKVQSKAVVSTQESAEGKNG